jgi:hypothetical protein
MDLIRQKAAARRLRREAKRPQPNSKLPRQLPITFESTTNAVKLIVEIAGYSALAVALWLVFYALAMLALGDHKGQMVFWAETSLAQKGAVN